MAKHYALPLSIAPTGAFAGVTQDSPADLAQSVALLLRTDPGERAAVPDYGYPSPLGVGVDLDEVADVVSEWEPRADPTTVEMTLNTLVEQHVTVHPSAPDAADAAVTDDDSTDDEEA